MCTLHVKTSETGYRSKHTRLTVLSFTSSLVTEKIHYDLYSYVCVVGNMFKTFPSYVTFHLIASSSLCMEDLEVQSQSCEESQMIECSGVPPHEHQNLLINL